MTAVVPAHKEAEWFPDARGAVRSLRVRWHHEADVVVLSLWRGGRCTGTFRLAAADVPALVEALDAGEQADAEAAWRRPGPTSAEDPTTR